MTNYLLSIDPGETTGWAIFDFNGKLISKGAYDRETFDHAFMRRGIVLTFADRPRRIEYKITRVVCESFYTDPDIPQGGSQGGAQKVIGIVERECRLADVPLVMQRSAILNTAVIHAGYEWPMTRTGNKKHLPDEDSAYLHGFYYFVDRGIIHPNREALEATL